MQPPQGYHPPPTIVVQQAPPRKGCMSGCVSIIGGVIVLVIVAGIFNSLNGNGAKPTATAAIRTPTAVTAAQETAIPAPTATPNIVSTPTVGPMIVTVKDNPVNVRQAAALDAPIVTTVDVGLDLFVLGPDTTGPDGQTRWVHVQANGTDGYVRSDLVTAPHPPPTPTPTVAPVDATSTADTARFYASVTAIANATPVPTLTSAQRIAQLNDQYPAIDAADLSKRPDFYKGKQFRITGQAFNVAEQGGITAFSIWAETANGSTVAIAVGFRGSNTSIQEGVRLTVYGTGIGTISGKNGFGATVTEAAVNADYIGPPSR